MRTIIAVVFAGTVILVLLWLFPTAYGFPQTKTGASVCAALGGCGK